MKKMLIIILFILFSAFIQILSLKGIKGTPSTSNIANSRWQLSGPFELSPEKGRFALMLSLVENNSFSFTLPIARFAVPDLGYINGKYVSLFAPLVSYLIMPGYLIGSQFGLGQVGAFSVVSLIALLNGLLIILILLRLKANLLAALLASLTFLFATPAYAYSVTVYQHHFSVFLILLSLYFLLSPKKWLSYTVYFFAALSVPLDYPNLFLMMPLLIAATFRIFTVNGRYEEPVWNINLKKLIVPFFMVLPPLLLFFWFNNSSYQSPFQFSGTVARVTSIDNKGNPSLPTTVDPADLAKVKETQEEDKSAINFFNPRNLLSGFYTHLISPDRGIVFFTPVILFGIIGLVHLYRLKKYFLLNILLGVIGINLILYSMWGDPWGGWAYGSRYLIPAYAVLSILIGISLSNFRNKTGFMLLFLLLLEFSLAVNTLGALTSIRNPPDVEIPALEKLSNIKQKYSFDRNIDYVISNKLSSYVFNVYGSGKISAYTYYCFVLGVLITGVNILAVGLKVSRD